MATDWHAYINQSLYVAFVNSERYAVFMDQVSRLQSLCSVYHGDLRDKDVPKQIIKEKTNEFAIRKGYPPFCFRFQCLRTGRKSKYIKHVDYGKLGITQEDAICGGAFDYAKQIEDSVKPLVEQLRSEVRSVWEGVYNGSNWWSRYSDYLASEDWYNKRALVIARDGGRCVLTGYDTQLQVHHLTYQNVGRERLDELVTLYKDVHDAIHNKNHPKHGKALFLASQNARMRPYLKGVDKLHG